MIKTKNKIIKHKGFTLVELVIVVTILAILATIGFISFNSYTKNARDANRIMTLSNISDALALYYTKTLKYPIPDGETSSGYIVENSEKIKLTEVGIIGDNISRLLNINKTPIDPISNDNFMYGISYDRKAYQIAGTIESELAKNNLFIKNTYAANPGLKARVLGSYKYPLKKGNKLYNIPSLLHTGTFGEFSNNTKFIVDKGSNIPYKLNFNNIDNSVAFQISLKKVVENPNILTLTGFEIPSINSTNLDIELNDLAYKLGETVDNIGVKAYGYDNYFKNVKKNIIEGNISPELLASGTETDIIINNYSTCETSEGKVGGDIFEGGDGTSGNPYQIKYDYQVDGIRCNLSANYELIGNINLVNYLPLNGNVYGTEGWLPIGDATNQFEGRINGNGYTIVNLGINRPTTESIGFIGEIGPSGIITNLNLNVKNITGSSYVGGFVGRNEGDISYSNIIINGDINGIDYIGAFAGAINGDIFKCNVNITGNINGDTHIGGFIGKSYGNVTSSNISHNGNINGNLYIGGFAGELDNYSLISLSGSSVNITGDIIGNERVGGFIGNIEDGGNIYNSSIEISGDINGDIQVGGFAGDNNGIIENSKADIIGDIIGKRLIGGFVGDNNNNINNIELTINGNIIGTEDKVGGFAGEAQVVKNANASITGKVEGGDNGSDSFVGGFIGRLSTSGIIESSNLVLGNGVSSTMDRTGGFVGQLSSSGIVFDSTANINGNITGTEKLGGFVGINYSKVNNNTLIINGNIDGIRLLGGFVGRNGGEILKSKSKIYGNVTGSNDRIGGFVGESENTIKESSVNITGKIEGGHNTSLYSYIGGFIGTLVGSGVVDSCNVILGEGVTGTQRRVGGFAGNMNSTTTLSGSLAYVSGNINGNGETGDFIGVNLSNIKNSYTNKSSSNGYFGWTGSYPITGTFNGISWDSNTADTYGIQNFTDFNFLNKAGFDTNIWGHESGVNDGLPYLK